MATAMAAGRSMGEDNSANGAAAPAEAPASGSKAQPGRQ